MKIAHIITGLSTGGAEMMLFKLLSDRSQEKMNDVVISLTNDGPVGSRIKALGISVRALGMNPGFPSPHKLLTLVSWLREGRFDLVQTWMYHADLFGGIAGKLAGNLPVVWGLRHSDLNPSTTKPRTLLVTKVCALLSPIIPECIVSVSQKGIETHVQFGYDRSKMCHIANGFDLNRFKVDAADRDRMRQELKLSGETLLIGTVGRYHAIKDYSTFIQAAGIVAKSCPDVRFALCGEGLTWDNAELVGWILSAGIVDRCFLLGFRNDVHRFMNALDMFISSSRSEGFANVIGEAMACGVPCVVTDVGDSAFIVESTGRVVPPQNPNALAHGMMDLISNPERKKLGQDARHRIVNNFSLPVISKQFLALYKKVLDENPAICQH